MVVRPVPLSAARVHLYILKLWRLVFVRVSKINDKWSFRWTFFFCFSVCFRVFDRVTFWGEWNQYIFIHESSTSLYIYLLRSTLFLMEMCSLSRLKCAHQAYVCTTFQVNISRGSSASASLSENSTRKKTEKTHKASNPLWFDVFSKIALPHTGM